MLQVILHSPFLLSDHRGTGGFPRSIQRYLRFSLGGSSQVLTAILVSLVCRYLRSTPFDRDVALTQDQIPARCPDFAVIAFMGAYFPTCLTQAARCFWEECREPSRTGWPVLLHLSEIGVHPLRTLWLAPMVRSAAISVSLTFNQGHPFRVQFPSPINCLCLRRQDRAGPICVGPPDSVIALRAPLYEQLIIRHFRPPNYILPQYVGVELSMDARSGCSDARCKLSDLDLRARTESPSFVLSSPTPI
jgi:hypothetical protein